MYKIMIGMIKMNIKLDQVDTLADEMVENELPEAALRRSTRDRMPSTRYSPNDYVLLTDGEVPECYEEDTESE